MSGFYLADEVEKCMEEMSTRSKKQTNIILSITADLSI